VISTLVVDDDFMVAKIHAAFVERTPGFKVVGVAHTGADALRAVHELHPALVLLDIYLPDRSGIEVLERLRAETPDVDVLVITAAREVDTVRRALRGGVVNYLIKPFEYAALRERLEHYAAAHHHLAEVSAAAQSDIDRLFGGRTSSKPLPKGLSSETAELVGNVLREAASDLSASECAARAGLSRISARRYLEYFAKTGSVKVRLRYGATGRPERRYRWRTSEPRHLAE
jgi:response regulator of citrate/malate metabolism